MIHDGSSQNRMETMRGASGTRRERRCSFGSAPSLGLLAKTLAIAAEMFMNQAGCFALFGHWRHRETADTLSVSRPLGHRGGGIRAEGAYCRPDAFSAPL